MAKQKVTITLDRSKVEAARALVGAGSTSQVIDVALDRLVSAERLRRDIAAYRRAPPTTEEIDLAATVAANDLADDTDWETIYPEARD